MKYTRVLVLGAAAAVALALPVSADPGKGRGHGQGQGRGASAAEYRDGHDRRDYTRLGGYERDIIRDYYGSDCPPGLAKKNNGCLPPGIAKKRYRVGHPLTDDVYVERLPWELEQRLPRLPGGYGYRILDGDLGVVEIATLVVLDALAL